MKRKRRGAPKKAAAKKPVAEKATPAAPVNADEEVFLNFVEQNVEENFAPNEVSDDGAGQFGAAKDISSSLSPSSSSDAGGDSFDVAEDSGWSDGPAAGWRVTRSANKRGWQEMNGREVDFTATGKRSKVVSPPGFSSMNSKEVPPVKKKPSHDPRYNRAELQACLAVIKKIMKMEEAVSFCSPVDPIAQGIPDYFTVIDTPMDFGTICSNLQNDVKYLNSDDVYKDVELIWKNCKKYNKKGDYIVYLMKLVQKKFMKYWTEAGLRTEMLRHDGPSHVAPPGVHTTRQSRHEAISVVDNMVNSYQIQNDRFGADLPPYQMPYDRFGTNQPPYQMQHDRFGTEQPQPRVYQPSYAYPYKSHQPPPSTGQMPQYPQYHAGISSSYTGHSNMSGPPYTTYPKERERQEPSHPYRPMTNGPNQSQKQQPQLSSRYTWQPNQTPSHPQGPQQSQFPTSLENTAHSNMSGSPYTPYRKERERQEPSHLFPPMTNGSTHSQKKQAQLSSHYTWQPNQTNGHLQEPQQSHFPIDSNNRGMSPEDGSNRERRHMERVSKGPRKGLLVVSPEQPLVEAQKQSEVSTPERKKGGRGPAKCRFITDLPEGHKIYVHINKLGQPVGPEAPKLSSFVGNLARDCNLAPLTYLSWKKMPEDNKEEMWLIVQSKFDIDPICKNWFLKSLASKWRSWKVRLKAKHYSPHTTNEERLRDCNKRVAPDQWAFLVAHWNSEEMQILSAINKANRSKHINFHATGSKSFARVREEEQARSGKELTRSELYILTRTRKDGQLVNDKAAEVIEKLREHEKRKEQQTSGASSGEADTFCEVMGKETGSHVRMFGYGGPTKGQLYGKQDRRSLIKEEVVKVVTKVEAMEEKYSSLEAQMAEINSNVKALIEKMDGGVSKQVNENPPEGSQRQSHSSSSHAVEVEDEDDDDYAG